MINVKSTESTMTNDEESCFGILYDDSTIECQKCKDARLCKRKQLGEPDPNTSLSSTDQTLKKGKEGKGLEEKLVIKMPNPDNPIWKKVRNCLKNWTTKDMILKKIPELRKEVLELMIYKLAPALEKEARWHIEK